MPAPIEPGTAGKLGGSLLAKSGRDSTLKIQGLYHRIGLLPVLFLVAVCLFGVNQPRFLSFSNLTNICIQSSYLVIVALAQTLVIITAGFDLSVGTGIALTSILTALGMIAAGPDPVVAIACGALVALTVGFLLGAINGVLVAVTRISPLIATLGTMTAAQGAALLVSSGMPIYGMPQAYEKIFALGRLLGIPVPVFAALVVLVLVQTLLYHTRAGRYFYAIGANVRAAHVSGVPVRYYLWLAYALTGLLTGFASFLLTARVGSGEPNLGANLPLTSIAAAVLGGVSLRGGQGSAVGSALGALFIVMMTNGMDLNGIGSYLQLVILGAVLIIASLLDMLRRSGRN